MSLITTIIPTYRRPQKLKRAITSVLNQTHVSIQVCVYDNASGDETEEIVTELAKKDARVKYFCHADNIGAAENFQFGLSRVDTPFFSFLADDDLLLPEFYQRSMEALGKKSEAAFFLGSVIDMEENGKIHTVKAHDWKDQNYWTPPTGLFEIIKNYVNWTGAVFRTELARKVGDLDVSLKVIDLDYLIRLSARFPFLFSKQPCALFIRHPLSFSGNCGVKLVWPGWNKLFENLQRDCPLSLDIKREAKVLLGKSLERHLFRISLKTILQKDFTQATAVINLYNEQFSNTKTGYLLCKLCKWCQKNNSFYVVFSSLIKSLLWAQRAPLQKKFSQYTKPLFELSQ